MSTLIAPSPAAVPLVLGQTTVTGLISDPGGNPATGGTVTFVLSPSTSAIAFRVAGTSIFAPRAVVCQISPTGQLLNEAGTGPCLIWGNPAILPANTTYTLLIAPTVNGSPVTTSTIYGVLIFGATYDLSNIQFAPNVQVTPQQTVLRTDPVEANLLPVAGHVFNIGSSQLPYAAIFADNLTISPGGTFTADNITVNNTLTAADIDAGDITTGTETATSIVTGTIQATTYVGLPGSASIFITAADFGAKGDGSTNDTPAIQAALNHAATLVPPPGTYAYGTVPVVLQASGRYVVTSLIIPTGTGLVCVDGIALIIASATGILVDTTVYSAGNVPHYNGIMMGIHLHGLGAATPLIGLRINNAQAFLTERCRFTNFADQAILVQSKFDGSGFTGLSTSAGCEFINLIAFNNVLNVGRASRAGAYQIQGSDHEFYGCQNFNQQSRTLSSANKFCVGWYLVGCNESRFTTCIGGNYDQGWYLDNNAGLNFFNNCRADLNRAEGIVCDGSTNIWTAIDLVNNAQETTNTYDALVFTSNAIFNRVTSGYITQATANVHRYCITDNNTDNVRPNAIGADVLIRNAGTAPINNVGGTLSVTLADAFAQLLAVNSATPSIVFTGNQPWKWWRTVNSSPTTITNFVGGFGGQIISVILLDSNTSIQNNANIQTSSGTNIEAAAGRVFTFRLNDAGTQWIQTAGSDTISGFYTPTVTNVANVTASTPHALQFMRVGQVVTVSGRVEVQPTAVATQTQLNFSLPITSNFTTPGQCGGTGALQATAGRAMSFSGLSTTASMQWVADFNVNATVFFSFTYFVN